MAKPHKNPSDKELSAESMEDINSISEADFAGITSLSATPDQIAQLRANRNNGQPGAAPWNSSLPPLSNPLGSMSIDPLNIAPLDNLEGAQGFAQQKSRNPGPPRQVAIELPPEVLMAEQQFASSRNAERNGFNGQGGMNGGMGGTMGSAMGSGMGGMPQDAFGAAGMPGQMPGNMQGMPGADMGARQGMQGQSMGMPGQPVGAAQGSLPGMEGHPDFFSSSAGIDSSGLPPFAHQSMQNDMASQGAFNPFGQPDNQGMMQQPGMGMPQGMSSQPVSQGMPGFGSMGSQAQGMVPDMGMHQGMMSQNSNQNMQGLISDQNMYQGIGQQGMNPPGMAPGAMGQPGMGPGGMAPGGSMGQPAFGQAGMTPAGMGQGGMAPGGMRQDMISAVQNALTGVQNMASIKPPPAVHPLHAPDSHQGASHSAPGFNTDSMNSAGQNNGFGNGNGSAPGSAFGSGPGSAFGSGPGFNQPPGTGVQPSPFGDPFSDPAFIAAQSIRPAFYGDEPERNSSPGRSQSRDSRSDDAPAYITPGVKAAARRNGRMENDSDEEGRLIPSPYIADRDEIERRTREIYGNDNEGDSPAAPVSSDDGEVHTNIFVSEPGKKAPIVPSFLARQMRQREQMQAGQGGPAAGGAAGGAAAGHAGGSALSGNIPPSTEHTNIIEHTGPAVSAESDYPLLNPKAPSTLINGFAYDFKGKSQDEVRSGLDEIISATPPLPADHVQQNGGSILAADMAQGSQYDRALRAYRDKSQVSTLIMGNQPSRNAPYPGGSGNITTVISHGTVTPPPGTLTAQPLQHKSTTPLTALMSSGAKQSKTILSDAAGRVMTDNYGRITRKINHDNTETNHSVRISAIDFSFKSRPGSDRSAENQNTAAGSGAAATPAAGSINFSDLPSAQPKMTSHEDQDDILIGSLGGPTSVDLSSFNSSDLGNQAAGSGSASDGQSALSILSTLASGKDKADAGKATDAAGSAGAAGAGASAGTRTSKDTGFKLVDENSPASAGHMPYSSLFDSPDAFGGSGSPRRVRPDFFTQEEPEIVKINPLEENSKATSRVDTLSGDIELPELTDKRDLKGFDGMTELADLGKALRNIADSLNSHTSSRLNFNPLSSPSAADSAAAGKAAGKDILSAPAGSEILGSNILGGLSPKTVEIDPPGVTVPAATPAADPAVASAAAPAATAQAAPAQEAGAKDSQAASPAAPAAQAVPAAPAAPAAPAGAAAAETVSAVMGGAPVDPKDAFSNLMATADAVYGASMGAPAPVSAIQPAPVPAAVPSAVPAAPAVTGAAAPAAAAPVAAAPALTGTWAAYLMRCRSMLNQCQYLAQSGMSYAVFEQHNIGFDPFCTIQDPAVPGAPCSTWQALTIPLGNDGYVVYNSTAIFGCTNGEPERRYMGTPSCLNLELLSTGTAADTPLFICSNELDALALESLGCKAMSAGLPYQVMSVLTTLQQLSASRDMRTVLCGPVYICIPADNPNWAPAHSALLSAFGALGIEAKALDLRSGCPTVNQCLIFNRMQFAASVGQVLSLAKQNALMKQAQAAAPQGLAQGAAATAAPVQAAPAAVAAPAAAAATAVAAGGAGGAAGAIGDAPVHSAAQAATKGLIMSLENLARMELIPALYSLSCDSEDLSNLVMASLFENRFSPLIYTGNMQQWQQLSSILSSSHDLVRAAPSDPYFQVNGYRARFVELPEETDAASVTALLTSALSHCQASGCSSALLIDTGDMDNETAAALAPVLARLAREFNVPVMAWCSPEQDSCFKGLTHQSITMEQPGPAQITFTAHDSTGAVHTFSAGG